MILRNPSFEDIDFIVDCYSDWINTSRGPIYPSDVRNWIIRYKHRDDEDGIIAEEDGQKVGFMLISYKDGKTAEVYELVVHRDLRGLGYGTKMWQHLKEHLAMEGFEAAEFDALPGTITDKIERGDFNKVGESRGQRTGLRLVRGRVTKDMEI